MTQQPLRRLKFRFNLSIPFSSLTSCVARIDGRTFSNRAPLHWRRPTNFANWRNSGRWPELSECGEREKVVPCHPGERRAKNCRARLWAVQKPIGGAHG